MVVIILRKLEDNCQLTRSSNITSKLDRIDNKTFKSEDHYYSANSKLLSKINVFIGGNQFSNKLWKLCQSSWFTLNNHLLSTNLDYKNFMDQKFIITSVNGIPEIQTPLINSEYLEDLAQYLNLCTQYNSSVYFSIDTSLGNFFIFYICDGYGVYSYYDILTNKILNYYIYYDFNSISNFIMIPVACMETTLTKENTLIYDPEGYLLRSKDMVESMKDKYLISMHYPVSYKELYDFCKNFFGVDLKDSFYNPESYHELLNSNQKYINNLYVLLCDKYYKTPDSRYMTYYNSLKKSTQFTKVLVSDLSTILLNEAINDENSNISLEDFRLFIDYYLSKSHYHKLSQGEATFENIQ